MNFSTYVSDDRCTLARVWVDEEGTLHLEVATRPDSDAVWGPPAQLTDERWSA